MFQGSITAQMRGYIAEMVGAWGVDELWTGCSGNFTIQRSLPGIKHHGNDVTIYSSALGWWAAGEDVPITLKEESRDVLGWIEPYLQDPASRVATIMLATRFFESIGKDNTYHRRMVAAYERQWSTLHAKTLDRVNASTLRLETYANKDMLEWVREDVPANGAVASFPPFWASGYEDMWAPLEAHLDWPAPEYTIMGEPEKEHLIDLMLDREHWFLGLQERPERLEPHLKGVMQTTAHGLPIYMYASEGPMRVVSPTQTIEPVTAARMGADDTLDGTERVSLGQLTPKQLSWLRSQFLDTRIAPAAPSYAFAVLIDGKIAGCLAFKSPENKFGAHGLYMLSDFPVAPLKYKRMAAFIAMAAQSTEVKKALERYTSRRIDTIDTTAFTDNEVSMKYRSGGLSLSARRPADNGIHRHQIQYHAQTGKWSLQEAYDKWFKKHGKHLVSEGQQQ